MATNSNGELQWQYQMNGNWRTLSDNQGRIINDAFVKNATNTVQCYEIELVVRGKPYLAKWLPDAASDLAPDECARLVSFEPVGQAIVEVSDAEQLRQWQRDQSEAVVENHTRLVSAEHAEQTELRRQMKEALESEDAETRAARAAMDSQNREAAKAAADRHYYGPGDKRSRRIELGKLYKAGVSAYRARDTEPASTATPGKVEGVAIGPQVLVRTRPLFAHEAERGEWEALSDVHSNGVVVHEPLESMRGGGMVTLLKHHSFGGNVSTVSTDAELYDSIRHLVQHAAEGLFSSHSLPDSLAVTVTVTVTVTFTVTVTVTVTVAFTVTVSVTGSSDHVLCSLYLH